MSAHDIVLQRIDHPIDGVKLVVLEAPQIAHIAADVLTEPVMPGSLRLDDDGFLVIADQVTYKPARFADNGRIVVCEKVREE